MQGHKEVKKTPVLVTLDVHPVDGVFEYISAALKELDGLGIKATFFVPISILEENRMPVRQILDKGHQIGSHGLFHNKEAFGAFPPERYDQLNEDMQRKFFAEAAAKAENILGAKITSFRSPCFGISGTTIRLLQEYGYASDFSVNSQRLDLLTSNPFSFKQLFAPRLPYHPSFSDPVRKGESRIWEVPLSSFIFPFAVMTVITLGLNITKLFFDMLYRESKISSKPIVYMAHPEEFSPDSSTYTIPFRSLGIKDFFPIKGEGIRARQAFRMRDPARSYSCNKGLLKYISSFKDTVFVTGDEYIKSWLCGS